MSGSFKRKAIDYYVGARLKKRFRPNPWRMKRWKWRPTRNFTSKYKKLTVSMPLRNTGQSIMPMMFQTRMVYDIAYSSDSGAGNFVEYLFRGNSIYDPYQAAGGTTVNGWTEMSAIYGTYRVIGSKATIYVSKGTNTHDAAVYLIPTKFTTALTADTARLHPSQVRVLLSANDEGIKSATMYARSDTMLGVKNIEDDVGTSSSMSANPAHEWYWHVCSTGTASEAVNIRLTITYYVVLSNLLAVSPGAT